MPERTCRDCEEVFDPQDFFWDLSGRKGVQRRHGEVGFIDQCGDCGLEDDNPATDRVIALEEGDGRKGSCEVTPISPDALGSKASGPGRYVNFSQRYQPLGCKK